MTEPKKPGNEADGSIAQRRQIVLELSPAGGMRLDATKNIGPLELIGALTLAMNIECRNMYPKINIEEGQP